MGVQNLFLNILISGNADVSIIRFKENDKRSWNCHLVCAVKIVICTKRSKNSRIYISCALLKICFMKASVSKLQNKVLFILFLDSVCESSFTSSPSKKPKTDDVIDLTETDSEDDEPRPESSHNISSGCVSPPVISIDSPAGPQSVSSVSSVNSISSFESPKRASSRSSSFSPSSSSSSSSHSSSRTVGYNPQTPQSPLSPPVSPAYSPRSPYKSPAPIPMASQHSPISPAHIQHSPISPAHLSPISPAHLSPVATPSSSGYLPPYPAYPPSFPMLSFPPISPVQPPSLSLETSLSLEPDDHEIEDFLQGLVDPYRWPH